VVLPPATGGGEEGVVDGFGLGFAGVAGVVVLAGGVVGCPEVVLGRVVCAGGLGVVDGFEWCVVLGDVVAVCAGGGADDVGVPMWPVAPGPAT